MVLKQHPAMFIRATCTKPVQCKICCLLRMDELSHYLLSKSKKRNVTLNSCEILAQAWCRATNTEARNEVETCWIRYWEPNKCDIYKLGWHGGISSPFAMVIAALKQGTREAHAGLGYLGRPLRPNFGCPTQEVAGWISGPYKTSATLSAFWKWQVRCWRDRCPKTI